MDVLELYKDIKIKENDYKDFIILTYSDHDNNELEHHICPYLDNTIASISHH